jgi:hypothetical protein
MYWLIHDVANSVIVILEQTLYIKLFKKLFIDVESQGP